MTALTYPEIAGSKTGSTSQEAAEAVTPNVATVRDRVLRAITTQPGTVDELSERLEVSPFTLRPRCSELKALGLIEDSQTRRPNKSGHNAIVWKSVDQFTLL